MPRGRGRRHWRVNIDRTVYCCSNLHHACELLARHGMQVSGSRLYAETHDNEDCARGLAVPQRSVVLWPRVTIVKEEEV